MTYNSIITKKTLGSVTSKGKSLALSAATRTDYWSRPDHVAGDLREPLEKAVVDNPDRIPDWADEVCASPKTPPQMRIDRLHSKHARCVWGDVGQWFTRQAGVTKVIKREAAPKASPQSRFPTILSLGRSTSNMTQNNTSSGVCLSLPTIKMSSCFGWRKSKADDREPLLPQYNDDTTLQAELHQKLHSYQMVRALTQGYMPSTEQTIVHLRTLLAADVLNPSDLELTDSGRQLVKFTKRWLQQFIELLQHKANKDQIQDFLWHLSRSRVRVDTAKIAQKASQSKLKANATAAYDSLNTVASLLLTNGDFRIFLSDLSTTVREVFRDTAHSVSNVAEDTARQIAPSEDQKNDLTNNADGQMPPPSGADLQNEVTDVSAAVGKGIARVAQDAEASAEEKLRGDEGHAMLERLKKAVVKLRRRPDYSESVSVLSIIAQRLVKTYSRVAEDTAAAVEDSVQENPDLDQALKNFWLLMRSFGDSEAWDKLEEQFKKVLTHLEKNPGLEDSVTQIATFVQKILTDPQFLDKAEANFKDLRRELREKESNSGFSEDLEAFLRQAEPTLRSVLEDEDVARLIQSTSKLFDILSPINAATNPELIHDSINVFVPALVDAVQHLPIPRLEVSTPEADILLENLIIQPGRTINHTSFLPYKLRVETYNDLEIRKARFKTVSKTSHFMTIKLDGLSVRADDVGFWLRAHSGIFRLADEGIVSFALDERGMDVHIDVEIAKERMESILSLRAVRVHIHKLNYNMRKSKFSWLSWIIKPLLRPILRKVLEKQMSQAIADFFHAANRELLFARERLRATRISDPNDLVTFFRAVSARLTPEEDPDLYTRVGFDEPGKGVFKGVYAPGSIAKVWHQEALEAAERIEEGRETRGWRNEIFDLQVANFT
ncbi:hypothetical protein K461DRAFT_313350 [Myriangium duriaei CBS 260.36]|uniref:Bactericidal permeability-increasing protein n=1 Tax=Myriangium duriaei CBS 260.36 TaxID=1168546 RepID=A0A9P4MK31_9PEZI|nr:hypothetical protein K461DRAFT_313350 [Myriangium duriaei CBS 260.36]